MIQAYPTKNGTGISLYGDFVDLNSLYETVHQIAETLDEHYKYQKGQHQLLMNLAYEIRKGYSGQRLKKEFKDELNNVSYTYFGFQLVWTDILIFVSTLRYNAGYVRMNARDQANIYLLEHVLEEALFAYDPKGANAIKYFISQRIDVSNQYIFILYQAIHIEFVSQRAGKIRFRNIPKLLTSYLSEWLPEYKELMASLRLSAVEQQCEIHNLEFSEFPEIKW